MGKVIRVDEQVWTALKRRAEPLEDTPNDVLRRVLGLNDDVKLPGAEPSISQGTVSTSKEDFAKLLQQWIKTDERTIGDVGSYGGKPWLTVELDRDRLVMNADTTREAIERFLQLHHRGDARWHVIPNARGLANKVTSDPDRRPIKGLFMYADRPGEREL